MDICATHGLFMWFSRGEPGEPDSYHVNAASKMKHDKMDMMAKFALLQGQLGDKNLTVRQT